VLANFCWNAFRQADRFIPSANNLQPQKNAMKLTNPILNTTTTTVETEFSNDGWQIVECQETGFVFLANPPSYDRLESEFAWEKTAKAEGERRLAEEPLLQTISNTTKAAKKLVYPKRNKIFKLLRDIAIERPKQPSLTILDVGCGNGHLLADIVQRFDDLNQPVVPFGIEVSNHLAKVSGEKFGRLGGRVVAECAVDGLKAFEAESIDYIILNSFLEHESQPLVFLRALATRMHQQSAVVLKVPNFDCWNRRIRGNRWCGFRYPDHVNYFTPSTLHQLASAAGMRVAQQTLRERFPLSDNMYAVLEKI
jgi:2-polyprenyl-3-methyl-5-hydroxy-6-metoxy-1,4-benzoquinol methylase